MRLTPHQQTAINTAAKNNFGQNVGVWLFGSRADDSKKGGDIDLLIRPDPDAADQLFVKKVRLLSQLERDLGQRKIDVVIESPHDTRPIVAIAHATGVELT